MKFPNTSILDPDNGPTGFATDDFQFAAIPFGKIGRASCRERV